MNVGVIVDNEFNSDIRVTKEVRILKEMGLNVYVLCLGFENIQYSKVSGVNIDRIKIKRKVKNILFFVQNTIPVYELFWKKHIYKFIKRHKLNVLHVHDLYMSKSANKAIKDTKIELPLFLDLHENYPEAVKTYNWTKGILRRLISKPNLWSKKEKTYLSYASKIIVLSDDYKKKLLTKYSFLTENTITVFPNVIDLKFFNSYEIMQLKDFSNTGKAIMLYFGAVAERRGVFNTLYALKEVILKGYKITLLIVGPIDKADKKKFELMRNDKIIMHNIIYIPWIDISELISYLNISDFCLAPFIKNPQHESGIANKIFQYMYGKKAIVVSDCKPQAELVKKYNCGLVFSNHDEYVKSIITLIENKDLCIQMGMNAYNALVVDFCPNKINKNLIKLYKNPNKFKK